MSDKKPNWFKQHKEVIPVACGIILLLIIAGIASGGSKQRSTSAANKTTADTTTTQSTTQDTPQKPTARQVTGTAVTLGAGTFTGGKDVATGLYDVTPGAGQSGNFMVDGTDSYNEILGIDSYGGVSKVRATISSGDKITISGLSAVTFTPVTTAFVTTYTPATLFAGTFTVGEDIGPGRYTVTPGDGQTGNFMVDGPDSYNEILGNDSSIGQVPSVAATLSKGDKITLSGMDNVIFTPSK